MMLLFIKESARPAWICFYKMTVFVLCFIYLLTSCTKSNSSSAKKTGFIDSTTTVFLPSGGNKTAHDYLFNIICIDKNNNKWLSGSDGIYEFDGVNWTIFNASNTPFLTHFLAGGILCGNDGTMYFLGGVTANGVDWTQTLLVYKNASWNSYALPFSPLSFQIDKSTGSLYFLARQMGTRNINGIFKYQGAGSFADSNKYDFIDCGDYNAKGFFVSNNEFFVSYNQVEYGYPVDSNNFGILVQSTSINQSVSNYPDSTLKMQFYNMASTDGKKIFMFALTNWWEQLNAYVEPNLFYFEDGSWSTVPIPPSVYLASGISVHYANDGTLWMASSGSGLTKYANQQFTSFPINILYAGAVSDFAIDDNNVKWIASWNTGLIKFTVQ